MTDINIHDTLTKIGGNPFQYFNALIGIFKNMELTFRCIKDSYAYKWAENNGFTVEEIRVYDYNKLLTEKKDYTVSYKNNIKVNDAQTAKTAPTITVTGKGNYSGQRELEVTITDNKLITKMKVGKIANQSYTGKEIKPEITVKDGKTLLKQGTDYTLEYRDNTDIGKRMSRLPEWAITAERNKFSSISQAVPLQKQKWRD